MASSQGLGAERSIPHWLSLGLPQRVQDPKAPGPGPTPVNGQESREPGSGGVSLIPVCAPRVLWGQALLWVSGQLKGRLG